MKALVNVYLRKGIVLIAPCGGGGGLTYEAEPIIQCALDPSVVEFNLVTALESSRLAMRGPNLDLRSYRSPVYAFLGIRGTKTFYSRLAFCQVYEEQETLLLQRQSPAVDGRGFTPQGEPMVVDQSSIGTQVVEVLTTSPVLS